MSALICLESRGVCDVVCAPRRGSTSKPNLLMCPCAGLNRTHYAVAGRTDKQPRRPQLRTRGRNLPTCCSTMSLPFQRAARQKARRQRVQASLVKHKVTLWSSPSSDVCDKRVIQLEMDLERQRGPCKSGRAALVSARPFPRALGTSWVPNKNPLPPIKWSGTRHTSSHWGDCCNTSRSSFTGVVYLQTCSLCVTSMLSLRGLQPSPGARWRRAKASRGSSRYRSAILSFPQSLPSLLLLLKSTIKTLSLILSTLLL